MTAKFLYEQQISEAYLVGLLSDVFAAITHNHDGVYAAVGHNHNGVYAAVGHSHDAAAIASGLIDPARLGTGTANAGTVLHGDSVFRAISGGSFASLTGAPTDNTALATALNGKANLTGATFTGADTRSQRNNCGNRLRIQRGSEQRDDSDSGRRCHRP